MIIILQVYSLHTLDTLVLASKKFHTFEVIRYISSPHFFGTVEQSIGACKT